MGVYIPAVFRRTGDRGLGAGSQSLPSPPGPGPLFFKSHKCLVFIFFLGGQLNFRCHIPKILCHLLLVKTLWCPTPARLPPFIAYPVRNNALQVLEGFIVRHDVRDIGMASASLAAVLGLNPGEGYASDNAVVPKVYIEASLILLNLPQC